MSSNIRYIELFSLIQDEATESNVGRRTHVLHESSLSPTSSSTEMVGISFKNAFCFSVTNGFDEQVVVTGAFSLSSSDSCSTAKQK